MAISRRLFLASPLWLAGCASVSRAGHQSFIQGTAKDNQGRFFQVAISSNGETQFALPLNARAHGTVIHPNHQTACVVARRPGSFALCYHPISGQVLGHLTPKAGQHFMGHACYDHLNRLWLTGVDSRTSEGYLYGFDQEGELIAHKALPGLGPHELLFDGSQQLIIAMGGIHTRQRQKLNLDSMAPSLIALSLEPNLFLNPVWQLSLNRKSLSIRHLAIGPQQQVLVACQDQQKNTNAPLLYHTRGQTLIAAVAPQWQSFNHYLGSVLAVKDFVLATSPRGHRLGVWQFDSQGQLHPVVQHYLPDVCALAHFQGEVYAGSGSGYWYCLPRPNAKPERIAKVKTPWRWDNHWAVMG